MLLKCQFKWEIFRILLNKSSPWTFYFHVSLVLSVHHCLANNMLFHLSIFKSSPVFILYLTLPPCSKSVKKMIIYIIQCHQTSPPQHQWLQTLWWRPWTPLHHQKVKPKVLKIFHFTPLDCWYFEAQFYSSTAAVEETETATENSNKQISSTDMSSNSIHTTTGGNFI